ncbi:extensin family protein [Xenophilus arseniciresistens]|uniref:Extensin family protein n=1 Tax=Xenophilus arseniciresistens TaxID=1283306 RepID=A0AAE3SXN4_9BURK|nr:extensin family protein [Xenophilus arseniciresistens]MDA7415129.1 extensin family protein [Xenophilus arseniciresistens]
MQPQASRLRRWLLRLCVLSMLAAAAGAYLAGWLRLPPRWDPLAPLVVQEPANWLTPFKLRRTRADDALCLLTLRDAGLRFSPLPDRAPVKGCGLANAVRLEAGQRTALSRPTVLSCRAALSFALWERHGLQPAAQAELGQHVARIEHLGSYACRDINTGDGRATGRRSRHATADALDVSGFTLADGRRIQLLRDAPRPWDDATALAREADARFLHAAHAGACRAFDGTLGPGYNSAHRDHFHLEVGGWPLCR